MKWPDPIAEWRFSLSRKWRLDYAWPDYKVGVEVNGGVWSRGRHTRGKGYINDLEKLNEAQILGWIVLQFTPQQMKTWEAKETIERALEARSRTSRSQTQP